MTKPLLKIMVGTMEVGGAIMNVIYLVDEAELDKTSLWMIVSYLYQVTESEEGNVNYSPLPMNGKAINIRTIRSKMLATAEASANISANFLDVIAHRELNPSDIGFIEEANSEELN